MTNAAPILHCLDILEKEFDKAYVDLDVLIVDSYDVDESEDIVELAQNFMTKMNSCFAQLCHKTQSTAQSNAKLEALLLDSKENLLDVQAKYEASKAEMNKLIRENQLLLRSSGCKPAGETCEQGDLVKEEQHETEEKAANAFDKNVLALTRASKEILSLKSENKVLGRQKAQMENELFGTRLAAKYLDKELAGRIQQIQLLGREVKPPNFDKMWHQLEAEIDLLRHKTVVKACRKTNSPQQNNLVTNSMPACKGKSGAVRKLVINKKHTEGLGISITGGNEHGIPILVSDIHRESVAERHFYIGDALLSINGSDLKLATHAEAVALLSQPVEEMIIEALYVDEDDKGDSEGDNMIFSVEMAADGYNFYDQNQQPQKQL